jgi:hypothetical protein
MPRHVLGPFNGMSEKTYAWLLTTDRCVNCHKVPVNEPVSMYWDFGFKGCQECLYRLTRDTPIEFNYTPYTIGYDGRLAPLHWSHYVFGHSLSLDNLMRMSLRVLGQGPIEVQFFSPKLYGRILARGDVRLRMEEAERQGRFVLGVGENLVFKYLVPLRKKEYRFIQELSNKVWVNLICSAIGMSMKHLLSCTMYYDINCIVCVGTKG